MHEVLFDYNLVFDDLCLHLGCVFGVVQYSLFIICVFSFLCQALLLLPVQKRFSSSGFI